MTDREIRVILYGPEPVYPMTARSTGTNRWEQVNGDATIPHSLDWNALFGGLKNRRALSQSRYKQQHAFWTGQKIDKYHGAFHPDLGDVPKSVLKKYHEYDLGSPVFWFVDQPDRRTPAFRKAGRDRFVPILGADGEQFIVREPREIEELARFVDGPIHIVDPSDDYDASAKAVFDKADIIIGKYQDAQVDCAVKYGLVELIPVKWHPLTSPVTRRKAMGLQDSAA